MATTSNPPESNPTELTKPLAKVAYTELVAVNFQVPSKILKSRLPRGLELDYFNNETYVSLIAQTMRKVGVLGIPMTRGFVELSLRFYVHRKDDPNQKGACFIKNFVSSPTAAWILGNRFDREYHKMKMKSDNKGFKKGERIVPEVEYQWKVDDHWNKLRIRARGRIKNTAPETKVGFILSHNAYYASKDGKTVQYSVRHPKWTIWDAAQANFTCDVQRLFGKEFVKPLARRPASVFVTKGSDVTIYRPNEI